jgi:hypothetical protein
MNLIAYSDSESDGEATPAPKPALRQAPKPTFQKVVDRANPGRIKVNLPSVSQPASKDDLDAEAPPAKKPRLGGASAFGGFNAMLPAPKKPAAPATTATAGPGKRGLGKGLAVGVNLKTGAEPAFKRESKVEFDEYDEHGNAIKKEPMKKEDFRALLNLPTPKSAQKEQIIPDTSLEVADEAQSVPKAAAPRFLPMSVGKGKKKKPVAPRSATAGLGDASSTANTSSSMQSIIAPAPARKPKVSLFGVSQEAAAPTATSSAEHYQPMLYGADEEDDTSLPEDAFGAQPPTSTQQSLTSANTPASNDLTNIASELNLSEAERRQLFGKRGQETDYSSAKIVEFNTDTEYAHNEKLRLQGEQVQHNPLKSISGTGKNNLRSLISVATTQKDALEDHFAASHRNKKEAGNRYGW